MTAIQKVAVIGAGVMGAGIAAHVANAGVPVLLLDIVPKEGTNRNAIAEGAIQKLLKTDPAPLMHKKNARHITPGNTEDDLDQLAECDWIIEAVIERLDIKQSLYRKIEAVRKPGSVVSSNTSTLPIGVLTDGLPESFARDFLISHFFNPPRYMRLLEIVAGTATRADALAMVSDFCDRALGKGVVICKDTPGFIANRIGTFWLQCAVIEAMDRGITVEEADAAIGRALGIPKTGVFALLDLVGLDLMPHVLESLHGALPDTDAFQAIFREPELLKKMIADGYTGRKGKGGFYRLNTEGGGRTKEAIDLKTGLYAKAKKPKVKAVKAAKKGGPRALLGSSDRVGAYALSVMSRTLAYAAALVPEIAETIADVDEAMRLGYNWKMGPFELLDKIGPAWLAGKLKEHGGTVPPLLAAVGNGTFYRVQDGRLQQFMTNGDYIDITRAEGVLLLADVKRRSKPLVKNISASLWDVGDGVLCLEFTSKMNSLNLFSLGMVEKAVRVVQSGNHKGLVIYNEGSNFSVGANLALLLVPMMLRLGFLVNFMVARGQRAYKRLKFAPFPVVGAPSGLALGGGCEILLHCDRVQAHAETYTGLVETAVGIVPGWGGCKEMLLRWSRNPKAPKGPMAPAVKVFEIVATATVAKSAFEARDYLFIRPNDAITMNRDRLLYDAKAQVLALAKDYVPPESATIVLPGPSARTAMKMAVRDFRKQGKATPHDVVVADGLGLVLSGGNTDLTRKIDEDEILRLERTAFRALVKTPGTRARVLHMLKNGKPLRN